MKDPTSPRRPARSRKGFTLVELIVVVLILGALSAIAIGRFTGLGNYGASMVAKGDLLMIANTIIGNKDSGYTGFFDETRTGTLSEAGFKVPPVVALLVSRENIIAYFENKNIAPFTSVVDALLAWDLNHRRGYRPGGYLKGEKLEEIPEIGNDLYPTLLDPWGHRYLIMDHDNDQARIVSMGPDGQIDNPEGSKDDLIRYLIDLKP